MYLNTWQVLSCLLVYLVPGSIVLIYLGTRQNLTCMSEHLASDIVWRLDARRYITDTVYLNTWQYRTCIFGTLHSCISGHLAISYLYISGYPAISYLSIRVLSNILLVYLGEGHLVARVEHGETDERGVGVGRLAAPLLPEVAVLHQECQTNHRTVLCQHLNSSFTDLLISQGDA
jgi:hypothetical protein